MANIRIMLVEDERIVARDIESRLKILGYDVPVIASSGEEAIKEAGEVQPDLVLMDIRLKGDMDGVEATKQIRKRFDIPVIYLTAYADDKTLRRAKVTGPLGYVLKPFEERELHCTIEMAIFRHKMERKLKESEKWYRTTLRSIGDAVITTDDKGCITFMNHLAESITGWELEEAVGMDLNEVFRIKKDDAKTHDVNPAVKVIRDGVAVEIEDDIIVRNGKSISIDDSMAPIRDERIEIARDGKEVPVLENAVSVRDTSGNVTGCVLVFRDVTEKKVMEEELRVSRKLESIGMLAGGLAHDFNNLLQGILGNISYAKTCTDPEDNIYKRLEQAESVSVRARELTQLFSIFATGGEQAKKTTHIAGLIEETAGLATSGSDVGCDLSIQKDLLPVEAHEGQMRQVISNMVSNAREAMLDEGAVKISAENLTVGLEDKLALNDGEYVRITIEDHGMGIPRENLGKIFDPYFTTKELGTQKGMGFGLSICYSIIKGHGGCITVESEVGVGTTFYIYLPASSGEVPA